MGDYYAAASSDQRLRNVLFVLAFFHFWLSTFIIHSCYITLSYDVFTSGSFLWLGTNPWTIIMLQLPATKDCGTSVSAVCRLFLDIYSCNTLMLDHVVIRGIYKWFVSLVRYETVDDYYAAA